MKTPEKDSEQAKNTEIPMTANTRKRKSRLADDLANYMKELELTSGEDQLEVITLYLKNWNFTKKANLCENQQKQDVNLLQLKEGNKFGISGTITVLDQPSHHVLKRSKFVIKAKNSDQSSLCSPSGW